MEENNWTLLNALKDSIINDINKMGYNTSQYKFYISVFGVLIPFNEDEYNFICDELSIVDNSSMELYIGSELINTCMMVGWVDGFAMANAGRGFKVSGRGFKVYEELWINESMNLAVGKCNILKSMTNPIVGFYGKNLNYKKIKNKYISCYGIHQLNAEVIKEKTKRKLLNFLLEV